MKLARQFMLLVAFTLLTAVAVHASDIALTENGKVPGQPFVTLQQQIDALQARLSALQAQAAALQVTDSDLQTQIDQIQTLINQLQTDLDNIELTPGPMGPAGPPGATGAMGPRGYTGPQGPEGMPGNLQLAGQTCGPGMAVNGFDALGNLVCVAIGSQEMGMPLYDDFSTWTIDPARWTEFGNYPGCIKSIEGTDQALSTRSEFISNSFGCGINFARPEAVAGFQVDVTITEFEIVSGLMRAQMVGRFFNTYSPAPVDALGDVYLLVQVRDVDPATGVGEARWLLQMCANSACSQRTSLGAGSLGPVAMFETHSMGMQWNGATELTIYFDGAPAHTHDVAVENGLQVYGPAFIPVAGMSTTSFGATIGSITALFDNVRCVGVDGQPCPTY